MIVKRLRLCLVIKVALVQALVPPLHEVHEKCEAALPVVNLCHFSIPPVPKL